MENEATIARGPMLNIWRVLGWGGAIALILTPLIAMQFTREVNWTAGDFIFAIVMFGSVGMALELVFRKTTNSAYRGAIAAALLVTFLEIWVNLAVGIVGNEDNPFNLIFFGVILFAWAGALLARFRPQQMAYVMFATASLQAGIALYGYINSGDKGALVTLVFAGLWALAGALFHISGERR